ncbi:MAG TPA: hypothetical protein DCP63_10610 [Bacteroidetes bacterium]|nr:hypothetical protein [Bacteroidota bacterium]
MDTAKTGRQTHVGESLERLHLAAKEIEEVTRQLADRFQQVLRNDPLPVDPEGAEKNKTTGRVPLALSIDIATESINASRDRLLEIIKRSEL